MPRRLPPLNALRTFEAAGRHVSFIHAAEELSVTPGAVSRQVKVLEQWLGAPLFRRAHKQVSLTPLGRSYLEAVGEPLDALAMATDRASRREATRPLAIYCYPTFALRWLVPRWGRFYDAHPEIDVQLTTSLQPVDFARDDYDAAIRVGDRLDAQPGLAAIKLVDVELIPVCSPEIGESLNRPSDLTGATLLHNAPRPRDWRRWLELAEITGIDPDAGPRFDSLNLSIQAAIGGVGVGIAIRALVEEELASGRLIQPFGPSRLSSRPFYLTYPSHHARDKRLAVFAKWLNAEAASTERPGELGI
ncbi:MAG: transcriptional regulator GcvA [Alphaproteobacteria bacterium]|jgi:LysR family transcriptional regulator, glycine cleavage system transcriptional activator|nr:transcriptional regulator GcvA [Alphaproteobacteria bacterium]